MTISKAKREANRKKINKTLEELLDILLEEGIIALHTPIKRRKYYVTFKYKPMPKTCKCCKQLIKE